MSCEYKFKFDCRKCNSNPKEIMINVGASIKTQKTLCVGKGIYLVNGK